MTIQNRTQRIIGGAFALPEPEATKQIKRTRQFLQKDVLRLASARGALALLARALQPKQVWLPSYLCSSIVQGFQSAGASFNYFSVDQNLNCESSDWLRQIEPGDFVLRIHYFGFVNTDPVLSEARSRGALLVDDAAQALLSDGVGVDADFVVFSPRKFVGVPDGGYLVTHRMLPGPAEHLLPPPIDWWQLSLSAVTRRRDFDRGAGSRDWFTIFQSAEDHVPASAYAMSELTQRLVADGIDFDAIADRRRKNYLLLLEHLGKYALFPELSDGIVPLGFPVRITRRDAIRNSLFIDQIFPPVHWSLDGVVPTTYAASHRLAAEIMTLPCDQRYDANDIERIVDAWQRAIAHLSP